MSFEIVATSLIVGIAASLLGVFIILKRMALVSDVLSHVALPGMAIALMLNVNVFYGAFLALFLAVLGIFLLEKKSFINLDAIVGVFFTISLALGLILFDDKYDLLEGLFGNVDKITFYDFILTSILGTFVILTTILFFNRFAQATFSRDIAQSEGYPVDKTRFVFLFLLALIIALGIKVVGTLLMGALTILPVSAAKNISSGLRSMAIFSLFFGVLSVILGLYFASLLSISPSGSIILVGGIIFLLTLLKR